MHSDRMRTNAIFESMIQVLLLSCSVIVVLPFIIIGVIQDRICIIILDYNENSTCTNKL